MARPMARRPPPERAECARCHAPQGRYLIRLRTNARDFIDLGTREPRADYWAEDVLIWWKVDDAPSQGLWTSPERIELRQAPGGELLCQVCRQQDAASTAEYVQPGLFEE